MLRRISVNIPDGVDLLEEDCKFVNQSLYWWDQISPTVTAPTRLVGAFYHPQRTASIYWSRLTSRSWRKKLHRSSYVCIIADSWPSPPRRPRLYRI
jgi:hypothetical protein